MVQPGEYGTWSGIVEYSHAVMEAVRLHAYTGLTTFTRGGLEVGGVLYGERRGEVVRLIASRPFECEHANGPAFSFSDRDMTRFRELLKPLNGLRVVGWYCSHTRSGVTLNSSDCAIMERFFGERGSVALVVKPTFLGPVEATFYLQGYAEPGPHFCVLMPPVEAVARKAPLRAVSAVPKAAIEPAAVNAGKAASPSSTVAAPLAAAPFAASAPLPTPSFAAAPAGASAPAPAIAAPPAKVLKLPVSVAKPAPTGASKPLLRRPEIWKQLEMLRRLEIWKRLEILKRLEIWKRVEGISRRVGLWMRPEYVRTVAIAASAGLAVALAILLVPLIGRRPADTPHRIGLQGYLVGDRQLRVEWDRSAAAIARASGGTLEIRDGESRYSIPMDATQLRTSSLTYVRHSDSVVVRLKLGDGTEESVQVLAPSAPAPPAGAVPAVVAKATFDKPADSKAAAVLPPEARPRVEDRDRQVDSVPERVARRTPLKEFRVSDEENARAITLAEPPPVSPPAGLAVSAALPKLPIAGPHPTVAPPQRFGRVVWTGSLGRRELLELTGDKATTGSLSGALPGAAVKIAVYPAEFKRGRMVVYVNDAGRNGKTEPAGPLTGWYKLQYDWDPDRAKQISIVESPGAANQYGKLALRNEGKDCPMVVVEWRVE